MGITLNFADLWERCAKARGDQRAQVHGDRVISWTDYNRRANGLAATMLAAGVVEQDKVAQYLYNAPEYMQGVYASFKAGLVPVNTNYRYADNELLYLWDNSDAAVVMFHGAFIETIERIRDKLPKVKLWLHVPDAADGGSDECPEWAMPWEEACAPGTDENVAGPWGRSGKHLWFLYTGGTTGMPKGVMWEQESLVQTGTATRPVPLTLDSESLDEWEADMAANGAAAPVILPAAPLMHGTGQVTALGVISQGGCVVTLPNRSFDPMSILDTVEREKVQMLVIVGDAFARPIADALDAEPGRWDLSAVVTMVSSGVMWSEPIKARLLEHMPTMIIFDALGSSEALGMGANYSTKDNVGNTAKFELGASAVVIRDDGVLVEAGSGDMGRLGVRGITPTGYFKDPEKSAKTFPVIDGVRYSLPGDFATVEADGTITLLGRGSVCINTGGEKVFPEEVEEALKTHPDIVDAIAVGIPDERFGQIITAVIEPTAGNSPDEDAVIAHVKATLAAYKAPRRVLLTDSLTRAANGKIDYKKWTSFARDELGVEA